MQSRVWLLKIECGIRVKNASMLCESEISYEEARKIAISQFGENRVIGVECESN